MSSYLPMVTQELNHYHCYGLTTICSECAIVLIIVSLQSQHKTQPVVVSNLPIQRPADGLLWCPLVLPAGQDVEQADRIGGPEG